MLAYKNIIPLVNVILYILIYRAKLAAASTSIRKSFLALALHSFVSFHTQYIISEITTEKERNLDC